MKDVERFHEEAAKVGGPHPRVCPHVCRGRGRGWLRAAHAARALARRVIHARRQC